MKIAADNLGGHLAKRLARVYLLTGDEPLLVDEAAQAIRSRAREDGFTERERHVAERGFDWDALTAGGGNLSLFASRKLIELRLPTGKPGKKGAAALEHLALASDEDTCLIVFTPKLDRRTQSAKWVQALTAAGVMVQIAPVDVRRLPAWIAARMRARDLQPVGDAINILVDRVEGNLLAADQEIEKLKLLHGDGEVDGQAVARSVADSARFDVFALADSALLGDVARAVRVLDGLRAEGVEPTLVVWALSRELRTLCAVLFAVAQGQSLDRALAAAHVWSSKKALVGRAARRLGSAANAHRLLALAARCDSASKGLGAGDPWHELAGLIMALAGGAAATRRAG